MTRSDQPSESISRTTYNFLLAMANNGDEQAKEALANISQPPPAEPEETDECDRSDEVSFVVELPHGLQIITSHGTTLIPHVQGDWDQI